MKFVLLFLVVSFSAIAVEVAVLDETRNGTEIMFSFTDETLYPALDKLWVTSPCKTRFTMNGFLKENYANRWCRAELVKFIMNSGYKPIDLGRTFTK